MASASRTDPINWKDTSELHLRRIQLDQEAASLYRSLQRERIHPFRSDSLIKTYRKDLKKVRKATRYLDHVLWRRNLLIRIQYRFMALLDRVFRVFSAFGH